MSKRNASGIYTCLAVLILLLALLAFTVSAAPPPAPPVPTLPSSDSTTGGTTAAADTVVLTAPADGAALLGPDVKFSFTVSDRNVTDCFLLLDGEVASQVTIDGAADYTTTAKSIPSGNHSWRLSCELVNGSALDSEKRMFSTTQSATRSSAPAQTAGSTPSAQTTQTASSASSLSPEDLPPTPNAPDVGQTTSGDGVTSSNPSASGASSDTKTGSTAASDGMSFLSLVLLFLLAVLIVLGGAGGYLAYTGKLDLHAPGFGLGTLFGKRSPAGGDTATPSADVAQPATAAAPSQLSSTVPEAVSERLRSFIYGERANGYDDLTIRQTLLKRGWKKEDVDGVFQQIYGG